ncbi:MAG: 50S ribosomal protein L9 [Minisyncoccota bacterium]
MKIIFLKDMPRIGKKHEIKEVADGYGKHLLMTRVAELATPATVARIKSKLASDAVQKKVHEDLLLKNLEDINGARITLRGKANEKGSLFASIHKEEILAELKRTTHLDMNPDYVMLDKPIKELGAREVPVIIGNHRAVFTVVVETLS